LKTILNEKYFNVKELSETFTISGITVRKMIVSGEIPAKKIANQYLVSETDLKKYLESNKTNERKPNE